MQRPSSKREFRELIERLFSELAANRELAPRLRATAVSQRFEFTDVRLVLNVRAGGPDEDDDLVWAWGKRIKWKPRVRMAMSSQTAIRYFQGLENVACAIAQRRITAGGDPRASLALLPISKPIFASFRAVVDAEYPHLNS